MLFNLDVYNDLNGYLGIEPGNGTPDTDQQVLQAINAALQDIYTKGPYYMRKNKGQGTLLAPAMITIGVTNGSTAITSGQITANMIGCAIRISGEPADNEIVDAQTLLGPITQPTNGTVQATVYFNCIVMPSTVNSIAGNVFLDDSAWEIQSYFYAENQIYKQYPAIPYDAYYTLQSVSYSRLKVGVPAGYYIAPLQKQVAPEWNFRLMFYPFPSTMHTVRWDQELACPRVLLSDLEIGLIDPSTGQTDPDAPATKVIPIPGALHETTLLPLARGRLSSNPHFQADKRAIVFADAETALDSLKLLNPRRQSGAQIRPTFRLPN